MVELGRPGAVRGGGSYRIGKMASIVVIDEDGPIRALLSEWLGARGHLVRAFSPLEAYAGLAADLVLIDLPKPRQTGGEQVRRLRERFPGATLIGLSTQLGASLPASSAAAQELGLSRLLAKPSSREELLDAVELALAGAGRG